MFRICYKHFEYLMMSFDLTNASITFQVYINKTFNEFLNNFCVMYLNDILIFFKNKKSHVWHIRKVLKRLRANDLFANFEKCFFFKHEIDYLEFIISENDVTMNLSRVNIIMSWSMIQFFKNIQIFLKFVNFYRRFIVKFFQLLAFLSNMLKKMQAKVKKNLFCSQTKRYKRLINSKTSFNMHSFWLISIRNFSSDWKRMRQIMKSSTSFHNCSQINNDDSSSFFAKDDLRRNELRNAWSKIINHRWMF
jgi:hypothetical protein